MNQLFAYFVPGLMPLWASLLLSAVLLCTVSATLYLLITREPWAVQYMKRFNDRMEREVSGELPVLMNRPPEIYGLIAKTGVPARNRKPLRRQLHQKGPKSSFENRLHLFSSCFIGTLSSRSTRLESLKSLANSSHRSGGASSAALTLPLTPNNGEKHAHVWIKARLQVVSAPRSDVWVDRWMQPAVQ